MTEPELYRRILWDWKKPPVLRNLKVHQAIFMRPELASHIEHVRLMPSKVESLGELWEPPVIEHIWPTVSSSFQGLIQCVVGIIKTAKFPDPEEMD